MTRNRPLSTPTAYTYLLWKRRDNVIEDKVIAATPVLPHTINLKLPAQVRN